MSRYASASEVPRQPSLIILTSGFRSGRSRSILPYLRIHLISPIGRVPPTRPVMFVLVPLFIYIYFIIYIYIIRKWLREGIGDILPLSTPVPSTGRGFCQSLTFYFINS